VEAALGREVGDVVFVDFLCVVDKLNFFTDLVASGSGYFLEFGYEDLADLAGVHCSIALQIFGSNSGSS